MLRTDLTHLEVSPDLARRLGLVVTELASNAVYHAVLVDRPGLIRVVGYPLHDGRYVLCIEDDGVGLPPEFDLRFRPHGIGLRPGQHPDRPGEAPDDLLRREGRLVRHHLAGRPDLLTGARVLRIVATLCLTKY